MTGWVLAIDFGTSNTSASWRDAAGNVREVRLGSGGNLMPSAVFVGPDGLVVGEMATRSAQMDPGAFEPYPKRRLAEGTVRLGGYTLAATHLASAVLADVLRRAVVVAGSEPDQVVLTHPDRWDRELQDLLVRAAGDAGIPADRIQLLSEAQSAVWFYTGWTAPPAPGERIAVFDFGAGTCDVAVLQKRHDGSFSLLAADGEDGLGGNDLDGRVWQWVRAELGSTHPEILAELEAKDGLRGRLMLMDRIREAKETLSGLSAASIAVPGRNRDVILTLTRSEFERLIAADITEAVALVRRVFGGTGVPDRLYLTGGSSLIPLVHAELGKIAPVGALGDPQTVVSQGALQAPITMQRPVDAVPPPVPPGPPGPPTPPGPPMPQADDGAGQARRRRVWQVAALVAVLIALGGGVAWATLQSRPPQRPEPTAGGTTISESTKPTPTSTTSEPRTSPPASSTPATLPPGCESLTSEECQILVDLSVEVYNSYNCESVTKDSTVLGELSVSRRTAALFCERRSSTGADWPEMMWVYNADSSRDVNAIFGSLYEDAVAYLPETDAFPAPTSRADWSYTEHSGERLSYSTDSEARFAWTDVEWGGVVMVADSTMSNQELDEWFNLTMMWTWEE